MLEEIEAFLAGLDQHGESEMILTTVLDAEVAGGFTRSTVARFRGVALPAPEGRVRASFDGPARAVRCASALAEVQPELRAGVHTGECERRGGTLSGAALDIAASVAEAARPGEILATSTVHDLVALSGVAFEERGAIALPLSGVSREWRLFAVVR